MRILPVDPARGILRPGGPQTQNPAYFAVPNGLVGYWGFDPDCLDFTNNLAFDLAANGNNTANLLGTPKPSFANGQVGGALSFDGANSYVQTINNGAISGSAARSASFWAQNNLASISTNHYPFSLNGLTTGANALFAMRLDGTSSTWKFTDGSTARDTTIGLTTTWVHVCVTLDGSKVLNIYINGKITAVANVTLASINTTAGQVTFGGLGFTLGALSQPWSGLIDNVKLWNRALDPWEVVLDYQAGLAGRRDAGPNLPQYLDVA